MADLRSRGVVVADARRLRGRHRLDRLGLRRRVVERRGLVVRDAVPALGKALLRHPLVVDPRDLDGQLEQQR